MLEPFVIMVAGPVAGASAILAHLLVYYWLRDTVVWKSFATLCAFVFAEIVIVGVFDPLLAWFASYPTFLIAAGLSKLIFQREKWSASNAS